MATYEEIYTLAESNSLIDRVAVAITIAADTIVNEDPATVNHANRVVWAKSVFVNPKSQAKAFWYAMLAANNTASVAAINSASDATIQTAVNNVVDIFAGV